MGFKQTENTMRMSQRKYIEDILKRFQMEDCKSAATPLDTSEKLSKEMCPKNKEEIEEMKKCPYQNLIGALMYLATFTRPDIAFTVSTLSQYNTNYGKGHWMAAKRVLRYLKGTINHGLIYERKNEDLIGFTDADWGSNIDDRRSYTGFAFKFANAAVSWEARKQRTVALSSTEAEYMAIAEATKEAIHLQRFIAEIQEKTKAVTIYNDNIGAQKLVSNPIFHSRTKHIDIRYHFVRDAAANKEIELDYMPTEHMPADILTKSLNGNKHKKFSTELGMKDLTQILH